MSMTVRVPAVRGSRRSRVRDLRAAASDRDLRRLRDLLDPDVAVVVDSGEPDHAKVRVVRGAGDASLLLARGLGALDGREVAERPVNGGPGLIVTDEGRTSAAVAVDLTGRRVSVVWVLLHPPTMRRGYAV
ncbi:hypothetical protein [Leifsonia xyli]|uniref:hypothetical protein n=1 Tax=Leifsonia xyli TaxID=1575 RepID=UPI003D67F0AF